MPSALSWRQTKLYQHRCDLWRPTRTTTAGKPGQPVYSLVEADVKCFFEINPSTSSLGIMGRLETDIIFTLDILHFAEDQAVDEEWVAVNRTLSADGSQSANYGRFWVMRGNPRRISSTSRRAAGKTAIYASQEATAPTGVTV